MKKKSSNNISIVIPIYNEEAVFDILLERISKVTSQLSADIIFVNDGSSDDSSLLLEKATTQHNNVTVVSLSRNFGHQQAVSAGLEYAQGDIVVVLDGDLQDPPELIPDLVDKVESGFDVVYAVRKTRQEGFVKKFMYRAFYRVLRSISNIDIALDSGDFAALSRRVVDEINRMGEYNRFIRGLRAYVGFKQTKIEYDRDSRAAGKSKYSTPKLMRLAMDGLFGFSQSPLRIASIVGFLVAMFSIGYAAFWFIWRLISEEQLPGFATLAVAIFFLGGVQLFCVGLLGEYTGRIYDEVKKRPGFIVDSVSGKLAKEMPRQISHKSTSKT